MKILITGAAGFIGYHLANKLASVSENEVIGIDNLNSYYDTNLKKERLKLLKSKNINCFKIDIFDKKKLENIFKDFRPDYVYHLAAQAGVRFSIENPYQYIESNLVGFFNILECCKLYHIKKLFFAHSANQLLGQTICILFFQLLSLRFQVYLSISLPNLLLNLFF